jgi:hypothetical protein
MRARRRALPPGREHFWLAAFSVIGYGERILLPLLVWLGGIILAGLAYMGVMAVSSAFSRPSTWSWSDGWR